MASDKEQLASAAERLNGLAATVPQRATVFHERRMTALDEIAKSNRPFRLGRNSAYEKDALLQEAREIEALAPVLCELLTECDALNERAGQVEALARHCPDPAVAPASRDRLAAARASLLNIGVNCRTAASVTALWGQVGALGQRIETEARVLPLFSEALRVQGKLNEQDDLAAAVMSAEMERWRKQYLDSVPAASWILAAEQSVDGYRKKAVQPRPSAPGSAPPPPPIQRPAPDAPAAGAAARQASVSLNEVEKLLMECREWSDALTGDIDAVQPLMRRKRELVDSGVLPPADTGALLDDAKRLRDGLRTEVMGACAARVKSLRTRMTLFMDVCGEDPELRDLLSEVEAQSFQTPEEFRGFDEALLRAESKFGGTANNEQEQLHSALCARCAAVAGLIAGLRKSRRTLAVDERLRGMQERLPDCSSGPQTAEVSLRGLETCLELEGEFEAAHHESLADVRQVAEGVRAAGERMESLRALRIRLASPDTPDFDAALKILEEAGTWPQDAILNDCRERLKQFEFHHGREALACCNQAAAQVEQEAAFFRPAERELAQVNRLNMAPFAAPDPLPQDPASLAQVLESVAEHRGRVVRALSEAATGYRGTLGGITARLSGIAGAGGHDSTRDIAVDLLAEAETLPVQAGDDPLQDFHSLRQWVLQCETFFYTIEREQNEIREEAGELKAQLQRLRKQSRHIYHPRLFERAASIVSGAVLEYVPAADARRQLSEARALLQALEYDSLRAIVHEVDQGCARLQAQVAQSRDAAFLKTARRVLDELSTLDQSELPPLPLRRELSLLVKAPLGAPRRAR